MDFKEYDSDYFAGGNKSGYDNYETCVGVVRDMFDMLYRSLDFKPKTALDVGCAYGFSVAKLRENGIEAYGVEPPTFAYNKAKEKNWGSFIFCDYLPELGTIGKTYDLVTAVEVLEHVPKEHLKRSVERLWELTGNTMILMPNMANDWESAKHHAENLGHSHGGGIEDVTHISMLPKEWWEELFTELDLQKHRMRAIEDNLNGNSYSRSMHWDGRFFVFIKNANSN